jgi:hypothetical protein
MKCGIWPLISIYYFQIERQELVGGDMLTIFTVGFKLVVKTFLLYII